MLTQSIADKIHTKVGTLVNQPLAVTDPHGTVLASDNGRLDESAESAKFPWAIEISQSQEVVGLVLFDQEMSNHHEVAPLIRYISELILYQTNLFDQLPHQE